MNPFLLGRNKRALCGTSCRSQETWRRCSRKFAQIALRNARCTSELGVADSESYDRFRFQARQEQSLHLFPRRPRFANSSPWSWFYNSRNFWEHQMAPWRIFKEMEMHWARYFRTARNTGYNPGHQSPEQDHHMEGRWNLVGTRGPSCRVSNISAGRWSTWRRWRTSRTPPSFWMKRKQPSTDLLLWVPPIWHRIVLIYK